MLEMLPVAFQVAGYCPMGCGATLFVGEGGHITCAYSQCPNPCAVSELLEERETEHVVVVSDDSFSVQHPLRERLDGDLFACELHGYLAGNGGPPFREGRYRAQKRADGWVFGDLP